MCVLFQVNNLSVIVALKLILKCSILKKVLKTFEVVVVCIFVVVLESGLYYVGLFLYLFIFLFFLQNVAIGVILNNSPSKFSLINICV